MNYLLYLNSTYSYASPTLSQISIWKCVNTEESFRLYCYCREYHTQLYLAFLFIYFTARVVGGGAGTYDISKPILDPSGNFQRWTDFIATADFTARLQNLPRLHLNSPILNAIGNFQRWASFTKKVRLQAITIKSKVKAQIVSTFESRIALKKRKKRV